MNLDVSNRIIKLVAWEAERGKFVTSEHILVASVSGNSPDPADFLSGRLAAGSIETDELECRAMILQTF